MSFVSETSVQYCRDENYMEKIRKPIVPTALGFRSHTPPLANHESQSKDKCPVEIGNCSGNDATKSTRGTQPGEPVWREIKW